MKSLGDEVLHHAWRAVGETEAEEAHHYVQRILEDLYDDRETVLEVLRPAKERREKEAEAKAQKKKPTGPQPESTQSAKD